MAIIAIKKKNCYWCNIVTAVAVCVAKFVVIILIAVKGRQTKNDCYMQETMRAVVLSTGIIELGIIVVFCFVLRRLRKSKALGLHNNANVSSRKKFLEEDD